MDNERRKRWAGVIVGPVVVLMALAAIWKNEIRFDYHRAAASTRSIESPSAASSGELISLTGPMDRELMMRGDYVTSFTGFLTVRRRAEIYAWVRGKRKSGQGESWSRRWMSQLENNSRNRELKRRLSSAAFSPPSYEVGDLSISAGMLQLADKARQISPRELKLRRKGLNREGTFFYLRKNRFDDMGDERVCYSGVPVPKIATYFGKFDHQKGTADHTRQEADLFSVMIQDTGILHHIVAGDRKAALATMKRHLRGQKWMVRGVAAACVVFGFYLLFATVFGVLFHIPFIGRIAQAGAFALALVIGLPVAMITVIASYLVTHPLVLATVLVTSVTLMVLLRRRGKLSQTALKKDLVEHYGETLDEYKLKELEFLELAQLALSDYEFEDKEKRFLVRWAHKHHWDRDKCKEMLRQAKQLHDAPDTKASSDEHLINLIRLALADGTLTQYEIQSIRRVAKTLGHEDAKIRKLIHRVRQEAASQVA